MVRQLISPSTHPPVHTQSAVLRRDNIDQILDEKHILQTLDHPFIISLHFAFQSQSKLYFVMDFVPTGDLFAVMQDVPCHRISEDALQFLLVEIILALGHMHLNGITYRDLKMENILLDPEGHVKLTDFGVAFLHSRQRDSPPPGGKMISVVGGFSVGDDRPIYAVCAWTWMWTVRVCGHLACGKLNSPIHRRSTHASPYYTLFLAPLP